MTTGRALLAALLVAAPAFGHAAPIDVANALRLQGCGAHDAIAQPLRRNEDLDEAARRVADGEKLLAAATASGYRAKTSSVVSISAAPGELARVLEARFCNVIADPAFRDIGIFRHDDTTWFLFAAPLALDADTDPETQLAGVVDRINTARAKPQRCGRTRFEPAPALTRSALLDSIAREHAIDMSTNGMLSHEGSDGSQPDERASRAGYRWRVIAENVAAGQTTAGRLVETWLESPGHCGNLMDPRYKETGVAVSVNENDDNVIYWVQLYAAPAITLPNREPRQN